MAGPKRKSRISDIVTHLVVLVLGGVLGWYLLFIFDDLTEGQRFTNWPAAEAGALGLWLFWNLYSSMLTHISGGDFHLIRKKDSLTYLPLVILPLFLRIGGLAELFVAGQFAVIWLTLSLSAVFLLKLAHFIALFAGKRWSLMAITALLIGAIVTEFRISPDTLFDAFTAQALVGAQFAALFLLGVSLCLAKREGRRAAPGVLMIIAGAIGWAVITSPPEPPALPDEGDIRALPPAQSLELFSGSPGPIAVRMEIDGEVRDALHFVTAGSVSDKVYVPAGAQLDFGVGVPFYAAGLSDEGVDFSVNIGGVEKPVRREFLDPVHVEADRYWRDVRIALAPWADSTVEIVLKVEGAPHASVSKPRLVAPGSAKDRPNVVIILIDTLRGDRVGFGGFSLPTSPRMDAVAKGGAIFERTSSTAPWTEPAVASLLTGMLPGRMGVGFPDVTLPSSVHTLGEYLRDAGYSTAAFSGSPLISCKFQFDAGFDLFNESCEDNFHWRSAECLTQRAASWMDKQPEKPFFLYVHYVDPHARFDAPPPYHDRFSYGYTGQNDEIGRGDIVPFVIQTKRGQKISVSREDVRYLEKLYLGEIAYVDDQIGRLIEHMRERGLLENTYLVITADHGEEFLEHGIIGHIFNLHDTLLRVPLVFVGPGIPAGLRVDAPVSLADVTPTLLDMLGIEPKDKVWGRSFAGYLKGAALEARAQFAERADLWNQQWALISGGYKLILFEKGAGRLLFDLENDPGEYRNLAGKGLPQEDILFNELKRALAWIDRNRVTPDVKNEENRREYKRRLKAIGYIGE